MCECRPRRSIDAAVTIDAVGFADRAILKESLSQVLAKSIDEKARFSHCFDRYFFVEDMAGVDTKDKEERGEDTEASPGDVDSTRCRTRRRRSR